jgi:ABC-type glycerol-3-phosphate transport system substrate-binding protein
MVVESKYKRISKDLLAQILSGKFESGKLPPLPKLAKEYGVSLMTASRAVKILEEEGIVSCGPGSIGTLIDERKARLYGPDNRENHIWSDQRKCGLQNVKLHYMAHDYQPSTKEIWDKIIADFSSEYPWITVEFENSGSQQEEVKCDVFQIMGRDLKYYVRHKLLSDMTPFMHAHPETSGWFVGNLLDSCKFGEHLYGMPMLMNTPVIFYNKSIVKHPPASWESFFALAEQLTAKGKSAAITLGLLSFFHHWIGNLKREFMNPEKNTELESALKLLKYLYLVAPGLDGSGDPQKVSESFTNGDVAMLCAYTSPIREYSRIRKFSLGIAPIPVAYKQTGPLVEPVLNSINPCSNNQSEAWLFVKYLASPPIQRIIAEHHYAVPVHRGVLEGEFRDYSPELAKIITGRVSNMEFIGLSTQTMYSSYSRGYPVVEKYFHNELDIGVALEQLRVKMNEIFLIDEIK